MIGGLSFAIVPQSASTTERLAEYAARYSEIAQRSTFQQALLALNLTSAGTIVGFVLANHAPKALLLIVPVVSSTLGLIWLDHHRNIQLAGQYIKEKLWMWTPSWEEWRARKRGTNERVYWFAMGFIFAAGSIGSLVFGHPRPHHEGVGEWSLWSVGAVMTAVFVIAYVIEWKRPA